MSLTSSDPRSSQLKSAILEAMQSDGLLAPETFLGLPLADGFAVQADIFRTLGQTLKGSKLTLKGELCHSAPLLWVSEEPRQAYAPGISVEVELAFSLGKDIAPAGRPVTRQDVVDAIASVRIGVELLRSRYQGGARGDQTLAVADMMSNVGYVLGPELDRDLLNEGADIGPILLVINDSTAYDKPASHSDGDPLKTIVALANQAPISAFSMLKAGQVITTGTLCGLVPTGAAGRVEVEMGGKRVVIELS